MKIFLTCFVILIVMFSSWINDAAAQEVTPVSDRTPQVRDAIVAAAGVAADEVTEAHLAAITKLDLGLKDIRTLKGGDFDGLNNLTELFLYGNLLFSLPPGIFDDLTQLTTLWLWDNRLSTLPAGIFDDLTQLTWL
ncbi:MAG: leucine-rich repeat domain-containing protein, partial [Candidatus Poribacteria bacterium]|nr:leucine-rich repeat domain-containing protein [Candidatus Poribacteria bacterium]